MEDWREKPGLENACRWIKRLKKMYIKSVYIGGIYTKSTANAVFSCKSTYFYFYINQRNSLFLKKKKSYTQRYTRNGKVDQNQLLYWTFDMLT